MTQHLYEDMLSESFEVTPPINRNPKLKVIFYDKMNENPTEDIILKCLKNQNEKLLSNDDDIKIVKCLSDKKIVNKKTLIIEVPKNLHKKIIEKDHLHILWCKCKVFDAVQVTRCFKCSRFSHIESYCKAEEPTCPKCAGKHKLTECKSSKLKCINCVEANKNHHLHLNVTHAVWGKECLSWQKKLEMKKKAFQRD
jgi:hypothetical protein